MRFQKEVWETYSAAQNQSRRVIRRNERNGIVNVLPALADVLEGEATAGKVELGVCEIPVDQIVGIATETGKENYTSDFLPVPAAGSDFAEAWCNLYVEFLSDEGLTDPVKCFEYMGKFYVADGKKRVSVAKVHGAMGIRADVIRILPEMTAEPRVRSYYEFVRTFEKTGVYQLAFTNPCNTDEFLAAMGYDPDRVWSDSDRWGFRYCWCPFERALKLAFNGHLNITTADAVAVLMKKKPFGELKQLPSWTLAELMQESWRELYQISDPDRKLDPAA